MTRPTYADLLLTFTPGASTNPSTTQINALITNLFKQAFSAIHEDYSVDNSYIDVDEIYSEIITCASDIANTWHKSMNLDSTISVPVMKLSDAARMNIINYARYKRGVFESVSIWNSTLDDSIQ